MAKIARAIVKNPVREEEGWQEKEGSGRTELEREVVTMAREGTPQQVIEYVPVVREYWAPFNYDNFYVDLGRTDPYVGAEYNSDGVELDIPPYGAITFVEDDPIIGVDVIGSACVPPGFVQLFAEPLEWKYPRTGVKMKVDGLWGEHLRVNLWKKGVDEGWRTAGLSCASFRLPDSNKVTIMAGSCLDIAERDIENVRHDAHYCIRIIRVMVRREVKQG
jgi:hypothetical protein